ncbi:hypothetical protein NL108_004372 [Boleophthalmus pectinirostris]|uniref:syncoilin-like n=1 Tax=Boleophthalmus pectinirostris TaxID=150288 RepID=UPI0024322C47|nr:syncoilin-like [Boleophthalmus pectinirostris]KAJ0062732.1 hypothetical protein NL108_004372 [Boleophthalmus pectinirostris]
MELMEDDPPNGISLNTCNPYEEFCGNIASTVTPRDPVTHHISVQTDSTDLDKVGEMFERCIDEVFRLEMHRDRLIEEFAQLQEPMLELVRHLRGRLLEAQRLLTQAQVDYISVYEEVQQLKRKLFSTARDSIQSQVTLAARQFEVAQSDVTQEELKATIHSLTEEKAELEKAHKEQVRHLQNLKAKPRSRTMSDSVSLCRQASLRLQRRLSGSIKSLESWYEPCLMALLRRRQIGEDALRRTREQSTDLRTQLGPLREDVQRLETQRASLEKRKALMEIDREHNLKQHKDKVEELKNVLNDLEEEFETQKMSKNILADLKEGLLRELTFLRGSDDEAPDEHQLLSKYDAL